MRPIARTALIAASCAAALVSSSCIDWGGAHANFCTARSEVCDAGAGGGGGAGGAAGGGSADGAGGGGVAGGAGGGAGVDAGSPCTSLRFSSQTYDAGYSFRVAVGDLD